MNVILLLSTLLPLVGLNFWHTILLLQPSRDRKPHTISEHAVQSSSLLFRHRMAHTTSSVVLVLFGSFYLLANGYHLAGWLLISGAFFDILEVLTLNKKSASEVAHFNYHVVTAWSMALCYLLYASTIVLIAGFGMYLAVLIWSSFALLLAVSAFRRFRNFWFTQHIYFCFLALIMIVSHINILIK